MKVSEKEVREHVEKKGYSYFSRGKRGFFVRFFGQRWEGQNKEQVIATILQHEFHECPLAPRCKEIFNDHIHTWCSNKEWAEDKCGLYKDVLRDKKYSE